MRTSYRFSQYAKAGMVFAATTVTYFFARATGVLPSWLNLNWEESETTDIAVSEPPAIQAMAVVTPAVFDGFPFPDLSVTNFEKVDLTSSRAEWVIERTDTEAQSLMNTEIKHPPVQRHLLQQSMVSVVNPIPDQVIEVSQQYLYPLDDVFAGDYSLLDAVETGQNSLPTWLSLQYTLLSTYPAGVGQAGGVAVSGNTVFVANGFGGLQILDVSTPNNPILLSNFYSGWPAAAQAVVVNGDIVFMASGYAGLQILDVSNKLAPHLLCDYPVFINTIVSPYISGVVTSGNTVFIINNDVGVLILDVSDLRHPILLSTFFLPSQWVLAE